ncbi:MAG: Nif3-like dinuclear metal center hexameric protein [Oscillospiraceae bacterium]|nr:Nif3-like dinuclear metal center hexameric protein [Candidatus Equicaccousia limihippi]
MTVGEVYDILEKWAPKSSATPGDNPGFLVGNSEDTVEKILVTLDCTSESILQAIKIGANLIVTHHPIIYAPLKNVTQESRAYKLIKNGISVISWHTNLDMAKGGVNDVLAKSLGISGLKVLENIETGFQSRIGVIDEELTPDELAARCKEVLGGNVRYVKGDRPIKTVAVCGGSGTDMVYPAILCGADALVTADIKHSMFITAAEKGFTLIDAGHYFTENIIVKPLAEYLEKHTGLEVTASNYTPVNVL